MQLKRGALDRFYGCSGYPECKNIRKISKSGRSLLRRQYRIDEKCPVDNAQLVKRQGRFGEFISCSN
jgi:DNA topoisomerase-1